MDMLVETIKGTETVNVEEHNKQRGSIKAICCNQLKCPNINILRFQRLKFMYIKNSVRTAQRADCLNCRKPID